MVGKLEALAALSKALAYRADRDSDMMYCGDGAIGTSGIVGIRGVTLSDLNLKLFHEQTLSGLAGLFLAQTKRQGAPPFPGR